MICVSLLMHTKQICYRCALNQARTRGAGVDAGGGAGVGALAEACKSALCSCVKCCRYERVQLFNSSAIPISCTNSTAQCIPLERTGVQLF